MLANGRLAHFNRECTTPWSHLDQLCIRYRCDLLLSHMKTIELRGGPSHGKRMVVPIYSNEVSFADRKGNGDRVYCPSADRTRDGLEIWKLSWSDTLDVGAAPGFNHPPPAPS